MVAPPQAHGLREGSGCCACRNPCAGGNDINSRQDRLRLLQFQVRRPLLVGGIDAAGARALVALRFADRIGRTGTAPLAVLADVVLNNVQLAATPRRRWRRTTRARGILAARGNHGEKNDENAEAPAKGCHAVRRNKGTAAARRSPASTWRLDGCRVRLTNRNSAAKAQPNPTGW